MKVALVTTVVDNYLPELCKVTLPNLERYALNIGADFIKIQDRRYDYHPAYEKLQVYEISADYDKTILIDADIILHPRLPDLTRQVEMHQVGIWMTYPIITDTLDLWDISEDVDFQRHGGNFGVVGAMVCCTQWTRDIFKPLDGEFDIKSIQDSLYRPAIIDEYVMSKNLARYNLKVAPLQVPQNMIYHAEMTTIGDGNSIKKVENIAKEWA